MKSLYQLLALLVIALVVVDVFLFIVGPSPGSHPVAAPATSSAGAPQWFLTAQGEVITRSGATSHGSLRPGASPVPVVGLTAAPSGRGYYEVSQDGDVYPFGDATSFGSMQSLPITERMFSPVTGLAPTPNGRGYWEVNAYGAVYSFGDAGYYGSVQDLPISERVFSPVIQLVPTADGRGYWELDSAGYVYAFGDAHQYGYTAVYKQHEVAADMAVAPGGKGYWVVTTAGRVHAFGGARSYGSAPSASGASGKVVAIVPTADGRGYWLVTAAGRLIHFGDAAVVAAPRVPAGMSVIAAA